MKTLVVFYSKTGNTKKIALEIANKLKSDVEEIKDLTNRKGILNWLRAGRDGMKKQLTKIKYSHDPKKYDLIIVGTPVWGWNMVPAVRTFMIENKTSLKKVAFFSTSSGTNVEQTFADMKSVAGNPRALLSITVKEIKAGDYGEKVERFCEELKKTA
jgi:flavodoxin